MKAAEEQATQTEGPAGQSGPYLPVAVREAMVNLQLALSAEARGQSPPRPPVAGPPIAADNDPMEARVTKLEEFAGEVRDRLTRIEVRLDTFPTIFATKEDLHRELHALSWRFIGAVTTLGIAIIGAMVWIAKNIH